MKRYASRTRIGLALTCVVAACSFTACDRPIYDPQRDVIEKLKPASGTTRAETERGEAKVIRVRIHVDEEYRRQTLQWRARVTRQVESTNALMLEWLNARMEIVEMVEWSHDASTSELSEVLGALAKREPTPDVDRVIGVTGALAVVTSDQHQLGMAYVLGQHLVVRGMSDHIEREAIEESLDLRSQDERDAMYKARLEHKEATVMLHEIAHTYGAVHAREQSMFMSTFYSHKSNSFTYANEEILERSLALASRMRERPHHEWRKTISSELLAVMERDAKESRELNPRGKRFFEERDPTELTSAQWKVFERAKAQLDGGDVGGAWSTLGPLRAERAENPNVSMLSCGVLEQTRVSSKQVDEAELVEWCTRARTSNPKATYPSDVLAASYIRTKRHADALDALVDVETKYEDAGNANPNDWMRLSIQYSSIGVLSRAEGALVMAGMHKRAGEIRELITRRRTYHALPPSMSKEDEVAAWVHVDAYETAMRARDVEGAASALAALTTLDAEAPYTRLAACRLANTKREDAVSACTKAKNAMRDASHAHLALGIARMNAQDTSGVKDIERALSMHDGMPFYWGVLASAYEATKATAKRDALRERYVAKFKEQPAW